MAAYYNENDPYAAQWLRNLIEAKLIPAGHVDERDIRDVRAGDIVGYTQCHFFAGLGGWPQALALAGWPPERPVWTGSCPCQPFSAAGKRQGFDDERHLWPVWFKLIRKCRPATVFGEQVASAKLWLDHVRSDLERIGYAFGAAVLPACAVGAPHRRERLWLVADAASVRRGNTGQYQRRSARATTQARRPNRVETALDRVACEGSDVLAYADHGGCRGGTRISAKISRRQSISDGRGPLVADASAERRERRQDHEGPQASERNGAAQAGDVANAGLSRLPLPERQAVQGARWRQEGRAASERHWWGVEPHVGRVAHGTSGRMAVVRSVKQGSATVQETHWYSRVGALRALGNAIVPQCAAAFIGAYMSL